MFLEYIRLAINPEKARLEGARSIYVPLDVKFQ